MAVVKQPKIKELVDELKGLYEGLDTVKAKGYWVFSIKDLEAIAGSADGQPLVGVLFDSSASNEGSTNQVTSVSKQGSASLIEMAFVVIVGVPYSFGASMDNLVDVTDILDEAREAVLGTESVNSRGWQFSGESQIDSDLPGMVFYGQVWTTKVIQKGTFKQ